MNVKVIDPTSSKGIQTALDMIGTGKKYPALAFNDGVYNIDFPLKLNSGTTLLSSVPLSKNVIFRLVNRASTKIFDVGVPIIGQKESKISNIDISGLLFKGNRENQTVAHGDGYHNFIYFVNGYTIKVHDTMLIHSMGDCVRVRNSKNIIVTGVEINESGHDGCHFRNSENILVSGLKVRLCTNSASRVVNCNHVKFENIDARGFDAWYAGGPGIQIEHSGEASDDNIQSTDIEISNCNIFNSYGPGIWILNIGKNSVNKDNAKDLHIHDCTFTECGLNPTIDWVGGIVFAGWKDTLVENCTFEGNYNYGIVAMGAKPEGTDYTLIAKNCVIKETVHGRFKTNVPDGIGLCTIYSGHKIISQNTLLDNNIGGNTKGNIVLE